MGRVSTAGSLRNISWALAVLLIAASHTVDPGASGGDDNTKRTERDAATIWKDSRRRRDDALCLCEREGRRDESHRLRRAAGRGFEVADRDGKRADVTTRARLQPKNTARTGPSSAARRAATPTASPEAGSRSTARNTNWPSITARIIFTAGRKASTSTCGGAKKSKPRRQSAPGSRFAAPMAMKASPARSTPRSRSY